MFETFQRRKPCILPSNFVCDELKSLVPKWQDDNYLKERAGCCIVEAEHRSNLKSKFGISNKETLKFSDFLDKLKNNNEEYYLSVQNIENDEIDGNPNHIYTTPLGGDENTQLHNDFPLLPIMNNNNKNKNNNNNNNIIPYQINLWMGHNNDYKNGVSSSLHHDFHNNLYFVIRGIKKFVVYPPQCLFGLYTNGSIKYANTTKVFDNGLITYDKNKFREDGANMESVKQWKLCKSFETNFIRKENQEKEKESEKEKQNTNNKNEKNDNSNAMIDNILDQS